MIKASVSKYTLQFNRPSGTSRGILTEKDSWFISLFDSENPSIYGIGECSIIKGLSFDDRDDLDFKINEIIEQINAGEIISISDLPHLPALQFAIETAFLDFKNSGQRILFPSKFTEGIDSIKINGLIWMGDYDFMKSQIQEKLKQGYSCIKLKIGAINFEEELSLLRKLREEFKASELEIRVDANGAFSSHDALEKLKQLSEFELHSIEQPIKQGKYAMMAELCANSPLPIALDEELIGITDLDEKQSILKLIKPQYIILKPSLVGGFAKSKEWIDLANSLNIKWWVTSALESNIGLNAISQWTYTLNNSMPQGLGTGKLFINNIESPLTIEKDRLWFNPNTDWNLKQIL